MLDYAPRKLPSDEETVADLPECVAAFISYLEAEGLLNDEDQAVDLMRRPHAIAEQYRQASSDPNSWGPAKALFTQMEAEGVDPTDQAAIDSWLEGFNGRSREERDAVLGTATDRQPPESPTGIRGAPPPWEIGGAIAESPGAAGSAIAIGWLPAEHYERAGGQWNMPEEGWQGLPHSEYRLRMEATFRGWSAHSITPRIVTVDLDDYAEWCAEEELDPAESRVRYVLALHDLGMWQVWPPGRNDPCWCGSERKYKKCCGSTREAALNPLDAGI